MAIIDSVRKLAEKVGADTNGRTIADQMNLINQHLEATNGRDISEAVNYYADKAGGSTPTPETITVNMTLIADAATTSATQATVTTDKTYEEVKTVIQNGGKVTFNITYGVEGGSSEPLTVVCYDYNDGAAIGVGAIIIFTVMDFYRTIIWASDSESALLQSQTGQNIIIAS